MDQQSPDGTSKHHVEFVGSIERLPGGCTSLFGTFACPCGESRAVSLIVADDGEMRVPCRTCGCVAVFVGAGERPARFSHTTEIDPKPPS